MPRKSKLVIVGDNAASGQYMNGLRKLAENNAAIIFTGYQFGAVLQELFSNTRAFITASELEGLPITLLEALSYGAMCVTSDICPPQGSDGNPSVAVISGRRYSGYLNLSGYY